MAISILLVAAFAISTEVVMFKPMRKKQAGTLQLIR